MWENTWPTRALDCQTAMTTSAVSTLTRGASDIVQALQALTYNINAGKGLQGVLESNLGPRGSMKMLVSGAGDIKITKDGAVLLKEMVCVFVCLIFV